MQCVTPLTYMCINPNRARSSNRYLLSSYPEWKPVCTIPGLDTEGQIDLVRHLYETGVLLVKDADDDGVDE